MLTLYLEDGASFGKVKGQLAGGGGILRRPPARLVWTETPLQNSKRNWGWFGIATFGLYLATSSKRHKMAPR